MTLENIKREINTRIREIRAESSDFSGTECYGDLQKLLTKTTSRVSLCESAADIEALDDLLASVEDCYNDCLSEKMGERREVNLFDFNFELDENVELPFDEGSSNSEDEAPAVIITDDKKGTPVYSSDNKASESPAIDPSEFVKEVEELYLKSYDECVGFDKAKLRSLRKKALTSIRMAEDNSAAVSAVFATHNAVKVILKHSAKVKDYRAAKPLFDESQSPDKMKSVNAFRAIVGVVAMCGGAAYGLFDARWWPWDTLPLAITGFGVSYILISIIYAISITTSQSLKTARKLNILRLILAVLAAIGTIPLGFVFNDLGGLYPFAGAYLATLPFTLFGVAVYFVYRFKLFGIVRGSKRKKLVISKNDQAQQNKQNKH